MGKVNIATLTRSPSHRRSAVERSKMQPDPEKKRPNYADLQLPDLTFLNPVFSVTPPTTTSSASLALLSPDFLSQRPVHPQIPNP